MSTRSVLIQELQQQGISHPKVIDALKRVPREAFLPPYLQNRAYDNNALPIDCEQTISQPYIVALMTQALMTCQRFSCVLEIGTGSGYQTAILCQIFKQVYTIERIAALYDQAKRTLETFGYTNVHFKHGDGALGWEEHAPYDGIIVTAAAKRLPRALVEQLSAEEGILVIPLGKVHRVQKLALFKKSANRIEEKILENVCFVPLISNE